MTFRHLLYGLVLAFIGVVSLGACSSLKDECDKATVAPDGECSNEGLQCTYPMQACDGSSFDSSCVCTDGAWACPDPMDCSAMGDAMP